MYTGIQLYLHLPAIHAYTYSASSVANRDRDFNSYTYSDAETFTDGETGVNAEAASHAATSPITMYEKERHCSIRIV